MLQPALASSLDLRCFLLLLPTNTGVVVLELPDLQLERTWKVLQLAEALSTEGGVGLASPRYRPILGNISLLPQYYIECVAQ